MAQVLDRDSDFCLSPPPHFLPADDAPFNMAKKAVGGGGAAAAAAATFPMNQFPYEFGGFNSDVSSPVDSLATTESEEEDFFAELNRRLTLNESIKVTPLDLRKPSEVCKAFGGSPQSILGGIGSWSGRSSNGSPLQGPSPPATPYETEYDTAVLVYAAAGQVERLKMNNTEGRLNASVARHFGVASNPESEQNHMLPVQNHKAAFLAEQNYLAAARRAYTSALLYEQHLQNLNSSARHAKPVPQWHAQQHHLAKVSSKVNIQTAPPQRKESVGTGVFIPRRYNTSPAAPPRKRAVAPNAIVPAKVMQALNMSFEEINSRAQPHYRDYAASMSHKTYEALMVRRNAFLAQQQRRVDRADDIAHSNLEVCLPQEWSY